jgi:hypothetical protein
VLTGAGLADAMAGADVLVDAANSPSFEADTVMNFFTTSATNPVAAKDAGSLERGTEDVLVFPADTVTDADCRTA